MSIKEETIHYEILEKYVDKFFFSRLAALGVFAVIVSSYTNVIAGLSIVFLVLLYEMELIHVHIMLKNRNKRLEDLESCCGPDVPTPAGPLKK